MNANSYSRKESLKLSDQVNALARQLRELSYLITENSSEEERAESVRASLALIGKVYGASFRDHNPLKK